MKQKILLALLLSVMTLCSMIPTTAFANENREVTQNVSKTLTSAAKDKKTPEPSGASSHEQETTKLVDSGDCGENGSNVQWALYESGTLYIYGKGNMIHYNLSSSDRPYENYKSQIKNAVIESGVTRIGYQAFAWCESLTSVTIPNSVTNIGGSVFFSCKGLKSITIPSSVASIESCAFFKCPSLTSITISNGVESIGNWAFYGCSSLPSITIPNSVTCIGEAAFSDCSSLSSITIPNSVTSMGESVFGGCSSLTSITIPNGITSIKERTFSSCISLTSIEIPDSVTSIEDCAFRKCSSLKDVYYTGTKKEWNNISIGSTNEYLTSANIHYNSNDKMGDLDGDGKITSIDSLIILRQSVGLENLPPEQIKLCEVDGDGEVTSADALEVLRYSVGLATKANIGK